MTASAQWLMVQVSLAALDEALKQVVCVVFVLNTWITIDTPNPRAPHAHQVQQRIQTIAFLLHKLQVR